MNTPLPVIRASSMKLAASCPASISGEGVQIDSFDPTATEGTDVHRAIALSQGGAKGSSEPAPLTTEGEEMWALAVDWIHQNFAQYDVEVEKRLVFSPIAGTLDLVVPRISPTHGAVTDFKTTHREDDHEAQLIAYAYLAFEEWGNLETVDSYIVFLRREGVLHKRYTRAWVYAWMDEFQHNTLKHPEIYRPGEWCGRCKRKWNCPALASMNRMTASLLATPGFAGVISREMVPDMRMRVTLLEDAIKAFKNFVRDDVQANGAIDLGNGKELGALDVNTDRISILKSWDILTDKFTNEELASFVDVGKTAMLKLVASKVEKGKGAAQNAFMDQLRAAGAVTTEKSVQVRELNIRERK